MQERGRRRAQLPAAHALHQAHPGAARRDRERPALLGHRHDPLAHAHRAQLPAAALQKDDVAPAELGVGLALDAHAEATRATLSSVAILPPSPIQLVAADAEIPVGIKNDLPYPVTVTLHARSDDLRLEVTESSEVEIGPQQSTRASLPVKARVGSGTVEVDLSLTSPTGVRIGTDQSLEVNVRADWETIGLVILSVLAAAFLAIGAIRTVRRIRRRPETEGPETAATDTAGADTATDADSTAPKEQS